MAKIVQEIKHSGIVRRVDDLGRIALPKKIRKQFEIHDFDSLEIIAEQDGIKLVKYNLSEKGRE